jgi:hypothetical protein
MKAEMYTVQSVAYYHAATTACLLAGAAWLTVNCYQRTAPKIIQHNTAAVLNIMLSTGYCCVSQCGSKNVQ